MLEVWFGVGDGCLVVGGGFDVLFGLGVVFVEELECGNS